MTSKQSEAIMKRYGFVFYAINVICKGVLESSNHVWGNQGSTKGDVTWGYISKPVILTFGFISWSETIWVNWRFWNKVNKEQVIYSTTPKWIAPQAFLKIKVHGVVARSESYLCNLWEEYRKLWGCLVPSQCQRPNLWRRRRVITKKKAATHW